MQTNHGQASPLTPPPPHQAGTSPLLRTGPPARPATVLNSSRFRRLELSLSPPFSQGGRIGERHPTFRTKAAVQARATSAPGTTWPAIRVTARLIPGQAVTPGSD